MQRDQYNPRKVLWQPSQELANGFETTRRGANRNNIRGSHH
jgi:hypothetical protein